MSELKRIAVIGAGTMGHGIAQTAAQSGLEAVLHDREPRALERGMAGIRNGLDRAVVKGKLTVEEAARVLSRVRAEADPAAAVRDAQIVIEAVPENLELKQSVFRSLEPRVATDAILATNTSSLPVARIAEAVTVPDRVVGMHFFNPVPIMPLLEIVQAPATSPRTVERVVEAGIRLGKECIVVRDSPGFATSRLGVALGLEAIRMLEAGVASAEDIDKAMTLGYRHPMGPLRLTDLIGLDVRLDIARHLRRALDSEVFAPPPLLERMVSDGKLGKKTGQGFYAWTESR
jgi:3-hydroxybutyryl-CoA dehydrogenase